MEGNQRFVNAKKPPPKRKSDNAPGVSDGSQGERQVSAVQIKQGTGSQGTVSAGKQERSRTFLRVEKQAAAQRLKEKRECFPDFYAAAAKDGRKPFCGGIQQLVKSAGKV